jgi:hypothetical protein
MAKRLVMLARVFMTLRETYFFKMRAFCWLQNLLSPAFGHSGIVWLFGKLSASE